MNLRLLLAATALSLVSAPALSATIGESVKADMPSLMTLSGTFHTNPNSACRRCGPPPQMARRSAAARLHRHRKGRQAGVVAVLARPGPTLMIRADIDGLPIVEQTGCRTPPRSARWHARASRRRHAWLGHDTHITSWLAPLANWSPQGRMVGHLGDDRAAW